MGGFALKLETRMFGMIEYDADDVITFPAGLPSFEDEHSFLLLPLGPSANDPLCLQSITTPALTFVLLNPFSLLPGYAPKLQPKELKEMKVERDEDLAYYVLCAMKRPVGDSTVNLKCPVAVNPDLRIACQVILETDDYHMRHPLSEFTHSEEDAPC